MTRGTPCCIESAIYLTGFNSSAWDEIHDVFGDGHDYDWALIDDEGEVHPDDMNKDLKYGDVRRIVELSTHLYLA